MLSYQHIYHAGCGADVHKHAALALVLHEAVKSAVPLVYAETHAGRGVYDLKAPEAVKTGEAKAGVMRLAGAKTPEAMNAYLRVITRKKGEYPGSPLIAARILRAQDTLHLSELHPREYDALEKNFKADKRIKTYKADGYEAVAALGSPSVVFIDPSYEIKTEYEQASAFFATLHDKWPDAVIILWYPLLAAGRHDMPLKTLHDKLGGALWRQDAIFAEAGSVRGMHGSALAAVNLPAEILPGLADIGTWVSKNCRP